MRKQSKKDRMHEQIRKHGENLKRIFGIDGTPAEICSKLHRIELVAHKQAEDYCNGLVDFEQYDRYVEKTRSKVLDIIGQKYAKCLVVNGDPRGYALKISDKYVSENRLDIYRDMGGYGILAPEFDGIN